MNRYVVSVPIAGSAAFEVEAKNEKEAAIKVWDVINSGNEPDDTYLEYLDSITTGNILHAPQNEIEVRLIRPPRSDTCLLDGLQEARKVK